VDQRVTDGLRATLQQTLGDGYTLERELGGGGMSRVFVARENALGRDVVVKVLAPELSASVSAERFTREIATAARLQQANIVPVLAAGTSGGVPYYTMPFVTGESLRAVMASAASLSMVDRTNVLRDVARALAYAHGQGVIHRDIKPENILLSSGTAVVTDFGIAKAISAARTADGSQPASADGTLTQVGSSVGTPAYMAPEQAVGEQIDQRADLYAWGVVAYELLAGTHPFAGRTGASQLIAAHIAEVPTPLAVRAPAVPGNVAALVMQCLAKNPNERPGSANALLERLTSVATPSVERPAMGATSRARRPSLAAAATALLLIAGAAAWLFMNDRAAGDGTPASTTAAEASDVLSALAVLPFVNTSGDAKDEYFSDGLTDELTHALSRLPGLRLAGRSSSFSFKGKTVPAQDVGKALGVGAIVEGTVRRAGDRIRLTAQLTSTRDGQVLWSDAFERTGVDVFAVQDAFTSAIVTALTPRLGQAPPGRPEPGDPTSVAARGTADAVAYDQYLKGRYYWAQRGAGPLDSAVKYLEAAVQRDSTFARGWSALALAYVIRPNFNVGVDFVTSDAKGEVAARRALALDSTSADAYTALGFRAIRHFEFAQADAALATARRLEPGNAIAAHWSSIYYHAVGDTIHADEQMERALALDPLSPTMFNTRARQLTERRRFARALEYDTRAVGLSPTFFSNSATPLIWAGQADSAFRLTQRVRASDRTRGRFGFAIIAAAAAGEWDAARALQRQIAARGAGAAVFDRAAAALVFGDRTAAATLFVENLEHDGGLANTQFSVCFPPYDAFRTEPVWKAFLARHQLRECPYRSPWPIGAPPP
jgi:TolB-like protein/tetratricopeptide (TPR) repeat protein